MTSTQIGVQHPDGHVELITEEAANTGYMSAREYADRRAQFEGGFVVSREKTVSYTAWTPVDPEKAAEVADRKVAEAEQNLRDTLIATGLPEADVDHALETVRSTLRPE